MKTFLLKAFSSNSLLHTLYMGIIGAVGGAIMPFVNAWIAGTPIPTIHVILITAAKAAVGFIVGYGFKNGFFGGSGTAVSPTTQKLIQ